MLRLALHAVRLAFNGQVPFEFTRALITGRAHTVGTGIHNFMHAEQVANADNDPVVRARLRLVRFQRRGETRRKVGGRSNVRDE